MNEKFFDPVFFSYHFNYEERVLGLVEKFKIHLSLFSVFMHFTRCIRSYEKVSTRRPTVKFARELWILTFTPIIIFEIFM